MKKIWVMKTKIKSTLGKKKNAVSLESEILVYQIKFLLARAYSVAVRLFVSLGFIKAPQELNPEIGDKQNVRLF